MKSLKPFPFPINIGTDICQISRIYRIVNAPRGRSFVKRILTPEEQTWNALRLRTLKERWQVLTDQGKTQIGLRKQEVDDVSVGSAHEMMSEVAHRDPDVWAAAAFIAGRFAAKEAAIKAHSHRRLTFHDITIEKRGRKSEEYLGSGPPVLRIKSETEEEDDASAMISISHDGDYATAVCMAYDPSVVESRDDLGSKERSGSRVKDELD